MTRSKTDDHLPPAPASSVPSQLRPSGLQRAFSEGKFDMFGRRILTPGSRSGSAANSIPGTPRRGDSDVSRTLLISVGLRLI